LWSETKQGKHFFRRGSEEERTRKREREIIELGREKREREIMEKRT
jgi:hypothetical protein